MRKAVTLPEIMIAAALLLLVCSMVYLLFANCIILNQFNRERTVAVSHAEYILEEIKNEDFTDLEDKINGVLPYTAQWDWDTARIETEFDPGNQHAMIPLRNEMIDTNETGPNPALLDVVVTVSWQDRAGRAHNLVLETLMTEQ